jgi:hypothetical protein
MDNKGWWYKVRQFVLFCVFLYVALYIFIFHDLDRRYSIFKTVPILDKSKVFVGYTLISPYNKILDGSETNGKVFLLDMFGRGAHSWTSKNQITHSVLKPNGNLLAEMEAPKFSELYPPGGNTGRIQELNWDSKIVWEYIDERIHHDIYPMKNGDIVFARWEKTPAVIAEQVSGGVAGSSFENNVLWSDEVVELNSDKKVVWSWHAYEHLDPSKDFIGMVMPQYVWSFINGISYMEHNPIDGTEGFLFSMRSINTIVIVRKSDGKILWRSPVDMLSGQHDPSLTPEGNILAFDNGVSRIPKPFQSYGSRAVEINPKTNEIVWQFDGGKGPIDKVGFFSPIVGGAQRLENGNTFITDGPKGHLFEVTNKGEVVWDMVSPYTTRQTGAFPSNFMFKARRYDLNKIDWPSSLIPPLSNKDYFYYNLLKHVYP